MRNQIWRNDPATQKQIDTIARVAGEKQLDPEIHERLLASLPTMTKGTASDTMDWLFKQSRAQAGPANANPVTAEGFYQNPADEKLYRVVTSNTSGHLYAKLVTAHGWDYEQGKGAMQFLQAGWLMTPEQVRAYGAISGICANCSARLEDPVSKHIGLGTSCGPNILGKDAYNAAKKAAKADPEVAAQIVVWNQRKAQEKDNAAEAALADREAEYVDYEDDKAWQAR